MGKKAIIEILEKYRKESAERYGILKIGVFGYAARDEIGEESDVDVVVRINTSGLFMLFEDNLDI